MGAVPEAGASLGGALAAAPVVVGAILALGGLWMLARRRPAVIALPVLAMGVLLMLAPGLLPGGAPPPEADAPPPRIVIDGFAVARDAGRTVVAAVPAKQPPLPGREAAVIAIEASEAEPNDSLAGANRASLGTAILGTVAAGESDWFAFDMPASAKGTVVANLTVGNAAAAVSLLDDAGQTLGIATTFDALAMRKATLERALAAGRYYVLVRGIDAPTDYHLTVALRRR